MADGSNIVKVRDDCEPIYFSKCDDPENDKVFRVASGQSPDWATAGNLGIEDYIRVMNELLRGLDVLGDEDAYKELKSELDGALKGSRNGGISVCRAVPGFCCCTLPAQQHVGYIWV